MDRLFARPGQYLSDHLKQVACKAETFARHFDAAEFGRIAGLLHDLGKAEKQFQQRIANDDKDKANKKPHCHHGAAFLLNHEPIRWAEAIAINGHHSGLHNRGDVDKQREYYRKAASECEAKLKQDSPDFPIPVAMKKMLPDWLNDLTFLPNHKSDGWLATDLFTRFLFSALIDADRLDTEESKFGKDASVKAREWQPFDSRALLDILEAELTRRARAARDQKTASETVQNVWQEVGKCCREAAKQKRGLFSLTVPTGGGKTLAAMLFALHHAVYHNKNAPDHKKIRRIIVVIPYLSIIQQTAKEYRDVFESNEKDKRGLILEHHSQVENEYDEKDEKNDVKIDEISERRKLAAENWDAPIVVTTSVQFFDSLFSRRPAKARKLHNIAQSIVIFDEIQTLPPLMMQPILSAIGEFANPARPYGCSFVLCTATQPAFGKSEDLPVGLEDIRPIVPLGRAIEHFKSLERVKYKWPEKDESLTWDELADAILRHNTPQALVIVNTRKAARELHNAIKKKLGSNLDGLFHLSTWMMPLHRNEILEEVKSRLSPENQKENRRRCILISTQCIEAGVDVDFPAVWRAFGPYDSIVQAAGRCNRKGLIKQEEAVVSIFYPKDGKTPKGLYDTAIAQTELLRKMNLARPENPDSFPTYFRLLYQLSVPNECGIQQARSQFHFKEVDEMFKFIEQDTISVLIRNQYINGELKKTFAGEQYEESQKRGYFTREDWRFIQPFIINLPYHLLKNKEICKKLEKAFNEDNSGLYVWWGSYQGGFQGTGIDFEGPIPQEELLI